MDITTECFGCCLRVGAKRAYVLILVFDCFILACTLGGGIFLIVAEVIQHNLIYKDYYIYDKVLFSLGVSMTSFSGLLLLNLIPTFRFVLRGLYHKVLSIYHINRTVFYTYTFTVGVLGFVWVMLIRFLEVLQAEITLSLEDDGTLVNLYIEKFLPFVIIFGFAGGISVPSLIWCHVLKKSNIYFQAGLFDPEKYKKGTNEFDVKAETHLPSFKKKVGLNQVVPEDQMLGINPTYSSPKATIQSLVIEDSHAKRRRFQKLEYNETNFKLDNDEEENA